MDTSDFRYNDSFKDFHSPWAGHKFLARDIVSILKPKLIVELGTYKGTSLLSFAEGIKKAKSSTKLVGIDTWEEDSASGKYEGDKVLSNLKDVIAQYYSEVNIELIRNTFEQSVDKFQNSSIDILHIDGWHSYDAVKQDHESWKDKISENGVILFHDIKVNSENFGVLKYWEEIKREYPLHLEFDHSNGLGLLCKSLETFELLSSDFETRKIKYLVANYEKVKHELFNLQPILIEYNFILNSKWWKGKELLKKVILRR